MSPRDPREPKDRLKEARIKAGYSSARAAAGHFRWKPSSYAAHENGSRGMDDDDAKRYGRAFKRDPLWISHGVGDAAQSDSTVVKIMGFIGAGAEILPEFEQVPPEGLDQVDVMLPLPEEMGGFEVRGDSMLPRYDDGDVIVCFLTQRRDASTFVGEEVAVRTTDGRRFLKKLARGSKPRTFNLESFNARTIESVKLEWIGEIWLTLRSGQFRRIAKAKKPVK